MKAFNIIASLVVAAALVWIGWHFGSRHERMQSFAAEKTLSNRVGQAARVSEIMDSLEARMTDPAKKHLLLELFHHVAYIDAWYERASPSSRQVAFYTLTNIARQRAHWTLNYPSADPASTVNDALGQRLESVLKRPVN